METRVITDSKIEGDLEFDGLVIFENNIEITGKLIVGSVEAKKSIYVHSIYIVKENDIVNGFQKIDSYQKIGGYQKINDYQEIDSFQEIGGFQEIGSYQEIGSNQEVKGFQEIGSYQKIGNYQEIGSNQEVKGFQKIDGYQKVKGKITCQQYINYSFDPIDLEKISTKIIRFCENYYAERNFWKSQLSHIPEIIEALNNENFCIEKIVEISKKYKKEIFEKEYTPAIKQALEVNLK